MHPILRHTRHLVLLVMTWAALGLFVAGMLTAVTTDAWWKMAVYAVPLTLAAAPVSLSAWYVVRVMPLDSTPAWKVLGTCALASAVATVVWVTGGQVWWNAVAGTLQLSRAPHTGVMTVLTATGATSYLLAIAVHYMLVALQESGVVRQRELQAQLVARDAELRSLRAQLDPHFLFNSLNAIRGLIPSAPERARDMCQQLGDFLRECLTLGPDATVSVAREVGLAGQYLAIEHLRFGTRLQVSVSVDPAVAASKAPALLLQPLVENAVRHGIATCLTGGTIRIDARPDRRHVLLTVSNPRDAEAIRRPGTGLGMTMVRRRLAATYGDDAEFRAEVGDDHYTVMMRIPSEATSNEGEHEA